MTREHTQIRQKQSRILSRDLSTSECNRSTVEGYLISAEVWLKQSTEQDIREKRKQENTSRLINELCYSAISPIESRKGTNIIRER